MRRVTIFTKLRLTAAVAPAMLSLLALLIAGAFYVFAAAPRDIIDNDYAAIRAANGMDAALYRMDWGRSQRESGQIVLDQQRRFGDWIATARARATSRAIADRVDEVSSAAKPVFAAMSKALPGDDTPEPALRALEGKVADLLAMDEAALNDLADRAERDARVMLMVSIAGVLVMPWLCYGFIFRICRSGDRDLRAMRRSLEALADTGAPRPSALDDALEHLGYPRPNPMLADD